MLETQNIEALDDSDLQQDVAFLAAFLSPDYTSLDLTPGGVLYEEMLRPAGAIFTLARKNFDNLREVNSLIDVLDNPDNADTDSIDRIAANYRVTRKTGAVATGTITVIVESNTLVLIPSSLVFSAKGFDFVPNSTYTGLPTGQVAVDPDKDKILTARSDGTYSFTIDVTATAMGAAGNVSKDARFTTSAPITSVIDLVAAIDFTGGSDAESTQSLVERLRDGITTPSLSNRSSAASLIRNIFPSVVDISLIGAGDPEMTRDSHTILSGKTLGKVDVYVRTTAKPIRSTVRLTARLSDVTNHYWVLNFDRDTYPGLYSVQSVLPTGSTDSGSLDIISSTASLDTTAIDGVDFTPAMTIMEGVYSRYQTLSVVFSDSSTTESTVGATRDFDVTLLQMPLIPEISDWLLNRGNHPPGADYLVKAPIPCLVAVGMDIRLGRGDPAPDVAAIQQAVADAVNSVDFATGKVSAAVVANAVQSQLGKRSRLLLPMRMRGQILFPDGTSGWIFDNEELSAPDRFDLLCSTRTVAYFLDPNDVTVNVLPSDTRPV